MNRAPLNPITKDHIEAYRRDGVVCLRQMFDGAWIERLLEAWERVRVQLNEPGAEALLPRVFTDMDPLLEAEMRASFARRSAAEQGPVPSKMTSAKYMHKWDPDFKAFALESPAGAIVGEVLQANQVRFFWDQMFQKRAGGDLDTYWHTDQASWPTRGEQLPSMWLPLTPVSEAQSLEYIAGSHLDRSEYWGRAWNAENLDKAGQRPPARPDFTDFDTRRNEPGLRYLKWAMEPGDVMVFHPRLYHGGGPNRNPHRERIALSTRWFGDDVTWNPRPGDVNVPGLPHASMKVGEAPDDDGLFPVVWRRDSNDSQESMLARRVG